LHSHCHMNNFTLISQWLMDTKNLQRSKLRSCTAFLGEQPNP
jgi:hypothetical protein